MKESRLFSFLNHERAYTVNVLHGKQLIDELLKIHSVGENALAYYKQTLLSTVHLITFLKPQESLGIYIDSDEPYFRFKIEMGEKGHLRTLLLPEEFKDFPSTIRGKARVSKFFQNANPYTSIVELDNASVDSVINTLLKESYQTDARVFLDGYSDIAIMINRLPQKDSKQVESELPNLNEIGKETLALRNQIFKLQDFGVKEIVELVENQGLEYLQSKTLQFYCPCSKERMIKNLSILGEQDKAEVFKKEPKVEIRCDYCNEVYIIQESEL